MHGTAIFPLLFLNLTHLAQFASKTTILSLEVLKIHANIKQFYICLICTQIAEFPRL